MLRWSAAPATRSANAGRRSQEHEAEQDAQIQQAQPSQAPPATGGGEMSEMDRIDALKKLGDLHDSGVLTDEQFEAEKEKLI